MWIYDKICAKLWKEIKQGTMKVIIQLHMINLLIKINNFNWILLFICIIYDLYMLFSNLSVYITWATTYIIIETVHTI